MPADRAKAHLEWLSAHGVGRRAVEAATDLRHTTIQQIKSLSRPGIRRSTEAKILAVDLSVVSDGAHIPAGPTWRIINSLLNEGYTKIQLAEWLGHTRTIQLSRKWVTARNAYLVERLYRQIQEGKLIRRR